jgi:hypothetical protein
MNMVQLPDKEPIYHELYEAISHFWGRSQLVLRMMIEKDIDFPKMYGVDGWYDKTSQTGLWGHDWKFFFHGGGCTLTNLQTGEPIDWEGPDPLAFNAHSFIYHLEWRLEHEAGLPLLRAYVREHDIRAIASLIKELVSDGIISPDHHLNPITQPSTS